MPHTSPPPSPHLNQILPARHGQLAGTLGALLTQLLPRQRQLSLHRRPLLPLSCCLQAGLRQGESTPPGQ